VLPSVFAPNLSLRDPGALHPHLRGTQHASASHTAVLLPSHQLLDNISLTLSWRVIIRYSLAICCESMHVCPGILRIPVVNLKELSSTDIGHID
jgi:hypothetical protein